MRRLGVQQLSHSFGRFHALRDITLSLNAGEVLGIVGENGAGKSTLLNLWSGALQPTHGHITLDGKSLVFRSYHDANLSGVWRIFQDPAQISALPVYENLFLGHENRFTRLGLLRTKAMINAAQQLVATMGLDVDVRTPTQTYDFATRQVLEVGRAILLPEILNLPAGFVLFDEPTTGLTSNETDRLLQQMSKLRASGAGVAFVSHRLQEVFQICDRVAVLRDGALIACGPASDFDEDRLQRLMVGRNIAKLPHANQSRSGGTPRLSLRDLSSASVTLGSHGQRRADITSVSCDIQAGEIVGIGGLLGSGKGRVLRMIAGLADIDHGQILLDGRPLVGSVRRRIDNGIAFISSDRPGEALTPSQSITFNITLPSGGAGQGGFSTRLGVWRTAYERDVVRSLIAAFGVKGMPSQKVQSLSGGNQQKVALARWMHRGPSLLLIENPTAGVDVGAKSEIHRLLRELASSHTAIVFVSDDLPELIEMSDRILIMRDGELVLDVDNHMTPQSEHALVSLMIGAIPETPKRPLISAMGAG
jgi:ABC-type sugar transport system ATPase subunit